MPQWITTGSGVVLIAFTVWEVFSDLFQPTGSGAVSDWLGRTLFNVLRSRPRWLPLAGPLTVVVTIMAWVLLLTTGFALIDYGAFPDEFVTSTGQIPPAHPHFLSVFYISFETLVTFGYGDLVPRSMTMRLVGTVEALLGFAILTASVSSIVLIFPAIARLRLLANTIAHVQSAQRQTGVALADSGSDVVLAGLARDVTNTRVDLVHFPVVYYFASRRENAALPYWLPELARWAAAGRDAVAPAHVRLAAAMLDDALHDLAGLLAQRFLSADGLDRDRVFEAYAGHHQVRAA